MYYPRIIDKYLMEWKNRQQHKPILLRGARQVGKSWAVRHLGESFENFIEINFEKNPEFKEVFHSNLDVNRIIREIGAMAQSSVSSRKTLLFLDEIQECPEAIMAMRFFKEDLPELHIIGAGSLLEFTLENLPTFGVGRIHSLFMYPMTFDEFLVANGESLLKEERDKASFQTPLPIHLHNRLVELFRSFILVGGMPEVVAKWVENHDYVFCQEIQDDLLISYETDFPKYHKKVDPQLLRTVLRSIAFQTGRKFAYSEVGNGYSVEAIKRALELLILAGLCIPVTRTAGNGFPLGAEVKDNWKKILLLDTGLMLRLLNMWLGDTKKEVRFILTSPPTDLVNKGGIAEMVAGLEIKRYHNPGMRFELFYWQRDVRNSQAEVDYLIPNKRRILPMEVKSGTKGGMKSLWIYMREKKLSDGLRSSLENFGYLEYEDSEVSGEIRRISILPLYALSRFSSLMEQER